MGSTKFTVDLNQSPIGFLRSANLPGHKSFSSKYLLVIHGKLVRNHSVRWKSPPKHKSHLFDVTLILRTVRRRRDDVIANHESAAKAEGGLVRERFVSTYVVVP